MKDGPFEVTPYKVRKHTANYASSITDDDDLRFSDSSTHEGNLRQTWCTSLVL